MKISLNWLSDYVEIEQPAGQIAEILSDLGFPCEGIEVLDDDTVLDVEVTSNRGDCLSHIGVARELAAATGCELKLPDVQLDESEKDVREFASVEIAEPELCGRYTALIIEGVKVGPSPDWMVKHLEAVGLRSVSNVVDATNYAMMETGQPPHAFDYAKIAQGKIIVRKAAAGERIVSIDGTQCDLDPDMLVITDPQGPVAVAGIMGGLDTEVGERTTTILLEDAYFDPVSIRTTSRRLALPSEASFRFERIVDIERVDWAAARTAQLITQISGGKIARGVVDAYPKKPATRQVSMRLARLRALLGIDVAGEDVLRILAALKFQPRLEGGVVTCTVPSWRSDVHREVDLIEEVARVHGYDRVPTRRKIEIEAVPVGARERLMLSIGRCLNGCGYYETINVTFVDDSAARLFAEPGVERHMAVKDVSRKSVNILRQSLIGSLLGVLKTNANARNLPCRIFEIADTFEPTGESNSLPVEKTRLSLVTDGELRELTGVIEALAGSIRRDAEVTVEPADIVWAETGGRIMVNGEVVGVVGVVSNSVKEKFDFKEIAPCAAEIDLEPLLKLQDGSVQLKPIPRFPAIQRDLSVIVDENVRWSAVCEAVGAKAPGELEDIRFVGVYRGKGIASGKKSLTLSLRFRDEDGTLTHETVDGFEAEIVKSLSDSVGAELRKV